MRLWHKALIHILPMQQLVVQWRECCAIMKAVHDDGTPNNILVNFVAEYPTNHMIMYARMVHDEMHNRGHKCDWSAFVRYIDWEIYAEDDPTFSELFAGKMSDRYLAECVWSLAEMRDCGGLTQKEFDKIKAEFQKHSTVRL